MSRAGPALGERRMLAVSSQKIDAGDAIAGNQSLDLVENRHRVEWTQLRLQSLRLKPNGVTVGLSRLSTPRLPHVCADATAPERHQFANLKTHGVGDADNHFIIGFGPRDVARLFEIGRAHV